MMFCPKCGAQNRIEQKFCRSCGQSLVSVQMALEGRIDEAVATLEKDLEKLSGGALTLAIFAVIALIASFFSGFGTVTINLALGLLIAGPMIYKGLIRLDRSIKLLDQKAPVKIEAPSVQSVLAAPEPPVAALLAVPDTDPLQSHPAPASVTEPTTLQLNRTE
jgi:hypothetical protein